MYKIALDSNKSGNGSRCGKCHHVSSVHCSHRGARLLDVTGALEAKSEAGRLPQSYDQVTNVWSVGILERTSG